MPHWLPAAVGSDLPLRRPIRSKVPFQQSELRRLAERLGRRPPSSRWCGFGSVGEGDPGTLMLFAHGEGERCFVASRFDDGLYELRATDAALIGRGRSLDDLILLLERT